MTQNQNYFNIAGRNSFVFKLALICIIGIITILLQAPYLFSANLLLNPGFEAGSGQPDAWYPFPPNHPNHDFAWETNNPRSGLKCVSVNGRGDGFAMWQQIVPVSEGTVYTTAGYVDVIGIIKPGNARIEVVFRNNAGQILDRVELVRHTGFIEWIYDIPHEICVKASPSAARAEINLFVSGKGKARFDDIFFGPTPTGDIIGIVSNGAGPVQGAIIGIWGTELQAVSDNQGAYRITNVPDASPRYILIASAQGYRDGIKGDVDVAGGAVTNVDIVLREGSNPQYTDIHVKCGRLGYRDAIPPDTIASEAVIDTSMYPVEVKHYLLPHEYIDSQNPVVTSIASTILSSVPPDLRNNTFTVSHAAYEWIVKNVEWDGVYTNSTYTDPTSGAWQTINGQGWSFGHNFKEWLYLPSEMLLEHRGICIEHSKLGTALLRALDIPARPVSPYGTQFWAQLPSGEGYWVGMSTSGGRSLYKTNGDLFSAFESYSLSSLSGFPVDNGPWIHSDWYTENKCLWREVHPWSEQYEPTPEGLSKALSDLAKFAATGEAPVNPPVLPGPCYYIDYSDFTLDLRNIGNQRELNARFPLPVDNGHVVNLNKFAYFSDHPECVVSTWVDSLTYPHVKEKNLWFSINFDLSPLLPAPEEKLCDIKANGEDDILYLRKGEKLELTISTDPQSHKGEIMDYWVTATTPLGWYSYVPKKWQKGLTNGYRGSLIPLTNYNLSESSSLPTGAYTFFFSVDSPDGIPQGTFSDHVQVIIR